MGHDFSCQVTIGSIGNTMVRTAWVLVEFAAVLWYEKFSVFLFPPRENRGLFWVKSMHLLFNGLEDPVKTEL